MSEEKNDSEDKAVAQPTAFPPMTAERVTGGSTLAPARAVIRKREDDPYYDNPHRIDHIA